MAAMIVAAGALAASSASVAAPPDMEAAWQQRWPRTRTAHLDAVERIAIAGARLTAVDGDGAVVDDGAHVSRARRGLHVLAAAHGAIGAIVWARDGALVGVAKDGAGAVTLVPALAPTRGFAVRIDDSVWFTSGDQLVRYELATQMTTAVARLGKDYEGALAGDGHDVVVADRDAIWRWDGTARSVISADVYWPGEIATRGGAILADVHGHGATVLARGAAPRVSLGSGLLPTGGLGWLGDSAVFVGTLPAFTTAAAIRAWRQDGTVSSEAEGAWGDGVDAILCWRAALEPADPDPDANAVDRVGSERRLYQTARGKQICELRANGDELAWVEISRGEDCSEARHGTIVIARLRGRCE